jgi:excinuclease UvrABC nuclease subunit
MRIVRKIFPFRDKCVPKGELKNPDKAKPCFNAQLGLCPGPCAGWVSKKDYAKHVRHITLFFEGRKEKLIESLEKDMKALAKEKRFEDAEKVKKQIFALDHIQDIALLKKDMEKDISEETFRIEAYDVAHLSGRDVVGVMTVIEDGELSKSQYRKFKIKADKNDDVANLKEIVSRRLGHPEWLLPNLIVVDGGTAQMNAVKLILREEGLNIGVVSVVKDASHKAREIMGSKLHVQNHAKAILLANAEAHRFAIGYHRRLRGKGFRI